MTFAVTVDRLRAGGCVFAEDEARILLDSARDDAELEAMVARRVEGQPLEHVVGWAAFCGLRIAVDERVFVPRVRSEFLVEQAERRLSPGAVVVDLCCGSGAIGAALASRNDTIEVYAADIDPLAVACARRNVEPWGGHVHEGDLYDALPASLLGRVDLLVANAPYVPTDAIALLPAEARVHEARVALDGGGDGLDIQRRIISGASRWLTTGGQLLIETSERQAPLTAAAFVAAGFVVTVESDDERGATVVCGSRNPLAREPLSA